MAKWTVVIAGEGDGAAATERAMALVRHLEMEGHHIAHASCTTGERRQILYGPERTSAHRLAPEPERA